MFSDAAKKHLWDWEFGEAMALVGQGKDGSKPTDYESFLLEDLYNLFGDSPDISDCPLATVISAAVCHLLGVAEDGGDAHE